MEQKILKNTEFFFGEGEQLPIRADTPCLRVEGKFSEAEQYILLGKLPEGKAPYPGFEFG